MSYESEAYEEMLDAFTAAVQTDAGPAADLITHALDLAGRFGFKVDVNRLEEARHQFEGARDLLEKAEAAVVQTIRELGGDMDFAPHRIDEDEGDEDNDDA